MEFFKLALRAKRRAASNVTASAAGGVSPSRA